MMRFELGLEEPDPKRALTSALTIAGSYIVGGLIPLSPYFFVSPATKALLISIIATLFALLVFGYIKGGLPAQSLLEAPFKPLLSVDLRQQRPF